MAFTDIDRVNGRVIRKLHNLDKSKTFGFISGTRNADGDLIDVKQHDTLTDARTFCGFKHDEAFLEKIATQSMPKSFNPQNKPGYRADSVNSKKGA